MESIGDALQKANLSQYITPLLDIGADDAEQLASLPEPDFQSLLEMTGMSKKPFHVLRFKKAINRLGPPVGGGGPSGLMGGETVGESSTHTVTVYATQIDEPGSIVQRPAPVVAQPMQSSSASQHLPSSYSQNENSTSFFELMTRGGVPKPSRLSSISKDQLQALVDDTVPVQQELGPSPISPMIWDKGRLEIFRKASIIFSSSISPLTDQEQLLNEAALQLCLWDPTLLVRQKDLFQLAKKLIKQYPSIVLETEHPLYSTVEPKTDFSWPLSSTFSSRPPASVNRGPDGKFRNCFEENYERRELQIQQVELLIAENASKEKMKQALLLQAKEKMDYSLALKIQEELSVLGKTQREYKTEMSRLRRVQRRSVRHQEMKKVKKPNTFEENPTSDFQPNSTPVTMTTETSESYRLSSQQSNRIPVAMTTEGGVRLAPEDGEGIPLQLHTYIHESVPGTASVHSYNTGSNPVLSVSSRVSSKHNISSQASKGSTH